MQLIAEGDRGAFEALYDRYFNKLVWFANSFVLDLPQAEDIVQDVFVKIMDTPERFDAAKKFSTWIYVVTSNLCKQHLRNTKNRTRILNEQVIFSSVTEADGGKGADSQVLFNKIQTIYTGFSEKEKNIYTLRFEQELGIKEIADILAIPEGSVKSGIYYLLKKLATHLKDFSNDER